MVITGRTRRWTYCRVASMCISRFFIGCGRPLVACLCRARLVFRVCVVVVVVHMRGVWWAPGERVLSWGTDVLEVSELLHFLLRQPRPAMTTLLELELTATVADPFRVRGNRRGRPGGLQNKVERKLWERKLQSLCRPCCRNQMCCSSKTIRTTC